MQCRSKLSGEDMRQIRVILQVIQQLASYDEHSAGMGVLLKNGLLDTISGEYSGTSWSNDISLRESAYHYGQFWPVCWKFHRFITRLIALPQLPPPYSGQTQQLEEGMLFERGGVVCTTFMTTTPPILNYIRRNGVCQWLLNGCVLPFLWT